MNMLLRVSIAGAVLARRFKVSNQVAFAALFSEQPGGDGATQLTWLLHTVVETSADAAEFAISDAGAIHKEQALLHAVAEIEALEPDATWYRKWQLYQTGFAAETGLDYRDKPEAFKKAVQRAAARASRRHGQGV